MTSSLPISLLETLATLKAQQRALDKEIKEVQHRLTEVLAEGGLDDFRNQEQKNTFYHGDNCFIFNAGRETYDYSLSPDVMAAEDNLKEVREMAKATGLVRTKIGKPFWSVK